MAAGAARAIRNAPVASLPDDPSLATTTAFAVPPRGSIVRGIESSTTDEPPVPAPRPTAQSPSS